MVSLPAVLSELNCSGYKARSKKTFGREASRKTTTEAIREETEEEQESSGHSRADSCRRFRFQRRKSFVVDSDSGDSGPEFLAAEKS